MHTWVNYRTWRVNYQREWVSITLNVECKYCMQPTRQLNMYNNVHIALLSNIAVNQVTDIIIDSQPATFGTYIRRHLCFCTTHRLDARLKTVNKDWRLLVARGQLAALLSVMTCDAYVAYWINLSLVSKISLWVISQQCFDKSFSEASALRVISQQQCFDKSFS